MSLLQLRRTVEELNSAIEAKEELMQRCHELDLQVGSRLVCQAGQILFPPKLFFDEQNRIC